MKHLIVGCGGTGAWIAQCLAKMLQTGDTLILRDGDKVEKGNLDRQLFRRSDIGKNKAECLMGHAGHGCDATITIDKEYLDSMDLPKWGSDQAPDYIWCAADNNTARLSCLELADRHPNMMAIICGNETIDAEAYVYHAGWKNSSRDPRQFYPDLMNHDAHDPLRPACTGMAQAANPQLAIANMVAASYAMWLYWFWENTARPLVDKGVSPDSFVTRILNTPSKLFSFTGKEEEKE